MLQLYPPSKIVYLFVGTHSCDRIWMSCTQTLLVMLPPERNGMMSLPAIAQASIVTVSLLHVPNGVKFNLYLGNSHGGIDSIHTLWWNNSRYKERWAIGLRTQIWGVNADGDRHETTPILPGLSYVGSKASFPWPRLFIVKYGPNQNFNLIQGVGNCNKRERLPPVRTYVKARWYWQLHIDIYTDTRVILPCMNESVCRYRHCILYIDITM